MALRSAMVKGELNSLRTEVAIILGRNARVHQMNAALLCLHCFLKNRAVDVSGICSLCIFILMVRITGDLPFLFMFVYIFGLTSYCLIAYCSSYLRVLLYMDFCHN